ncbi:type II CAAX endopeptidase family protein [Tissierella sp. MB52-C2]|uniref:CPBP family intramembrane glutamic endopeptidase n=1 Tax=Tissierella sp. MB52-C2 TaxID=3070999 RepID=UPI00280B3862|nr:type II CAAX endopeptidase family protein [Tissierella sp. MB52-C2]WMM25117.1 type II CAAX endopeptidase family protein [Tissierella sp. MB52-C2]
MDIKILREEKSISQVNRFFFYVILWSVFIQFMPINPNYYQYIAFLVPISIYLFINRFSIKRILKPNILNLKSILIIFLIWLSVLPIMLLMVELYVHFFGSTLADIVSQDSHESLTINFFLIAITPAILEEVLMRGIILDGYRNKSRFVASIMNGFMFGMLHLNSFQFFHTFLIGIIASYLVFATNSIFAGMFIHIINNGLPLIIDYLYPIVPNEPYVAEPQFIGLLIFAAIGLTLLILLFRLLFKVNDIPFRSYKELSDERIFNLHLILSIFIFLGFSALIIFST